MACDLHDHDLLLRTLYAALPALWVTNLLLSARVSGRLTIRLYRYSLPPKGKERMATEAVEQPGPARKLSGERMAPARHVSLPVPLDERLDTAARKLNVSRSLLIREAVRHGLKAAVDSLRRDRRSERQSVVARGETP